MSEGGGRSRLPEGFDSARDPVEGNPFPPDDPRHSVWSDATRAAEEELRPIMSRIAAEPWVFANDDDGTLAIVTLKFWVWAKRGVHVVWSDAAVRHYDDWLVRYANGWLDILSADSGEAVLGRIRFQLAALVEHWKAEARRYRAAQERHAKEPLVLPSKVSAGLMAWRNSAIRQHLHAKHLTAAGLALKVAISDSAIRGIVREDRKRFAEDTRDRLLKELGITARQWYGL